MSMAQDFWSPSFDIERRDDGAIYKAYENDGLALPEDVTGSTEGQIVCRHWSAREAFVRKNRTTEYYQYTDTPEGTFWESTQIGTSLADEFSITVGINFTKSCKHNRIGNRFFYGNLTVFV